MTWYYKDSHNTPADQAFSAAYETRDKTPPTEKAWQSWFSTRALLQSIKAARSTDPKAIVSALENWSVDENGIKVRFRQEDHQLIRPLVIVTAKKNITDKYDYFDVTAHSPATAPELEAAYGNPNELGCRMEPL
jgi:branched-chain amino acid transport system substrate-binding protein